MSITMDNVLARLESELEKAMDTENIHKKREYLAAMKALCELALEPELMDKKGKSLATLQQHGVYSPQITPNTSTALRSKKEEKDDANGESLFDF